MSTEDEDIFWIVRTGDLEGFQTFIKENSKLILLRDDNGNNLLHMASANGHSDLINLILTNPDSSLLLNSPNSQGNNPLHWAVLNKKHEVISSLIKHGAEVSSENAFNETPVDVAVKIDDSLALRLFENFTVVSSHFDT